MAQMPDRELTGLLDDLASADPQVRDERALGAVVDAIMVHTLTADQRTVVAQQMLDHLRRPEIQARAFAPLVFGVLVEHGDWDHLWFEQVRNWYLCESDLRGHDAELGWLHAIAHGADFFGAVAHVGRRPAGEVLEVLAERLTTPTDAVWHDQEDARVAYAMALCLVRDPTATGWLDGVAERLQAVDGLPPVWAANTLSTMQSLALALEHELLFNGEPVVMPDLSAARTKATKVVQSAQPWFWRTA